jgi:hypothetical protein
MLGEYGVLLGGNGLMSMLRQLPFSIVNFLHTQEGQIAAGILLAVLFFLFGRRN